MKLVDSEWDMIAAINGWLDRDEADLLLSLGKTPWCEIGSWHGRSTRVLAMTGRGYAVDTWEGSQEHDERLTLGLYDAWLKNIDGLPVMGLRGDYEKMVDFIPYSLSLLFIDHEHTYEATRRAFVRYGPKVAHGGHIVIHDAVGDWWPEVRNCANDIGDHAHWVERRDNVGRCAVFRVR